MQAELFIPHNEEAASYVTKNVERKSRERPLPNPCAILCSETNSTNIFLCFVCHRRLLFYSLMPIGPPKKNLAQALHGGNKPKTSPVHKR